MFTILTSLFVLAVILGLVAWITARPRGSQLTALANVAEGRWCGGKTYLADAALATRYLLAKIGSDSGHIAAAGTADIPLGIVTDEAAAAEDPVNVAVFGTTEGSQLVVASAAIAAGDMIVSAASGKVRTLPATTGTYYIIGRAVTAAAADGDLVQITPSFPIQRVVP